MNLSWQEHGACVGTDPDQWYDLVDYPDMLLSRSTEGLRSICARCPVQPQCLEWALNHENFGMWGGLTPKERQKVRRDRGIILRDVA